MGMVNNKLFIPGLSSCQVCPDGMIQPEEGQTQCVEMKCPTSWNQGKFQGYEKCLKSGMYF